MSFGRNVQIQNIIPVSCKLLEWHHSLYCACTMFHSHTESFRGAGAQRPDINIIYSITWLIAWTLNYSSMYSNRIFTTNCIMLYHWTTWWKWSTFQTGCYTVLKSKLIWAKLFNRTTAVRTTINVPYLMQNLKGMLCYTTTQVIDWLKKEKQ